MIKPIIPADAEYQKNAFVPDEIIELFNKLIVEKYDGRRSRFSQEEILSLVVKNTNFIAGDVYRNRYLDVENLYRQAGWFVEYFHNEFNEPYFIFNTNMGDI